MYSGTEVRVPFCDHRIVEYAYNMPWAFKALDGREKGVERKTFESMLPEEIVWRKKEKPVSQDLSSGLYPPVRRLCAPHFSRTADPSPPPCSTMPRWRR